MEPTPAKLVASDNATYIDGIPPLRWGQWRDSSYCGAVTALLNASGIPVTYEEVMGLSGVCYQALMRDDWDPSSTLPQNGKSCEKNVGDALGIDVYTLQDENAVREQAAKSIDGGHAVLLLGGRWTGEWSLACGYAEENGERKFFGRTYFDSRSSDTAEITIDGQSTKVPENEIYTANKYFLLNGFPGWYPGALTRFYDRKCEPITRKEALKVSLETCIRMFEPQADDRHQSGYDAYDILVAGFELPDADYRAKCRCDQYHIGSMQDARRAAYIYLDAAAELLDGENKAKLKRVAAIYKTMSDNLLAAVPYEKTTAVFSTSVPPAWSSPSTWNAERRRALAAALKENKELECQARVVVKDILNNW